MELLTTKEFNGNQLDCYRNGDNNDFWATREQIGRLLEYAEPMKSVAKIHERNIERLNKFSTIIKLTTVEGGRTVTRDVIVYNFKGLLEICRYSNQPKANEIMDFLWEIADEIRRTGSYSAAKDAVKDTAKDTAKPTLTEAVDTAIRILEKTGAPQKQIAVELGKIYEAYTGIKLPVEPHHTEVKPSDKKYMVPSELADLLGIRPQDVNRCLEKGKFQNRVGRASYVLTGKGELYAIPRRPGRFRWDICILQELEDIWNAL